VVNAVTHTGTNRFEYDVFAFGTGQGLTATGRAQPALQERGVVSYDVGARISGPIVKDRLWFSAAVNPRVRSADRRLSTLGSFADERVTRTVATKLTWQASDRSRLELSVFGDPTRHETVVAPEGADGFTALDAGPYVADNRSGGISVARRP
jgi:hypothetical protein